MTNFQRTADWLTACGKEPSAANASLQIGCHIEEVCEFLRTLRTSKDGYALLLQRCCTDLEWFATKLKSGEGMAHIEPSQRVDALDALCDAEVTGNGVAFLLGMNKPAADIAVMDSNDSKLEDGKPVILAGGKIGKGKNYLPPDLAGFV